MVASSRPTLIRSLLAVSLLVSALVGALGLHPVGADEGQAVAAFNITTFICNADLNDVTDPSIPAAACPQTVSDVPLSLTIPNVTYRYPANTDANGFASFGTTNDGRSLAGAWHL